MKVSNQDKAYWVKEYGVEKEIRFLETLWKHNVDAIINPEKRNDARVHDLKLVQWPGELKSVETPIFKAQVLYDLDPQYAVSLNLKDVRNYEANCPHVMIFFHVCWEKETSRRFKDGTVYSVEPMQGVWMVWFPMFNYLLDCYPESFVHHDYKERENDTNGNAEDSYYFDVRLFPRLFRKFLPKAVNGKVVGPARNDLATHRL